MTSPRGQRDAAIHVVQAGNSPPSTETPRYSGFALLAHVPEESRVVQHGFLHRKEVGPPKKDHLGVGGIAVTSVGIRADL